MDIIASHTDKQEEIDEAIDLLRKSYSIAYAREVAVDLVKTAWEDGINRILPDGKSKQLLKLLGEYNVGRKIWRTSTSSVDRSTSSPSLKPHSPLPLPAWMLSVNASIHIR